MATQLELVNAALDQLGQQIITDIDSTTDATAIKAKRQWQVALDEFMCAAPWMWAKTRTTLTPDSPAPDFSWSYIYTLPDDFVTLVGLNEEDATIPSDLYEVNGGYLLTDEDGADIEYIQKFVAVGNSSGSPDIDDFLAPMDGYCGTALIHLLASKLAPVVAQDGLQKASEFLRLYLTYSLPQARVRNGNLERGYPKFPASESMNRSARLYWRNGS
jgi:hypothetical protein